MTTYYDFVAQTGTPPVFSPTDIAGLALWLKADAIVGLNDGDPVGTWPDSSGNGYDATQSTEANKPTYQTNELNGKPVVRFDGTDLMVTSSFVSALTQPTTIFLVAKSTNSENDDFYFYDGIASGNRHTFHTDTTGSPDTAYSYAGATFGSVAMPKNAYKTFTIQFNGASSTMYFNGSSVATGNVGTHTLTGLTVGARFNSISQIIGDIAEILIYDPAVSDANRLLVESYLQERWAHY